jgi:sodium-coupled neutral amino acid transporter 2
MSFSGVIEASLGKAGTLTSQLAVIINNLGGLVVFLIIIGDVLAGRQGEPGLLEPLGCA